MPWCILAMLFGCCALAMAAEVDVTDCALLLQFEQQPGFAADSTGIQPAAEAAEGASQAEGKFGSGCRLAPEQGWMDAGTNFGLSFCMPQQTISLWLRPDEVGDGPDEGRFILGTRESPERSSWRWNLALLAGGVPAFRIHDGQQDPPAVVVHADQPLPTDRWSHVAVVLDTVTARQVTLYVNGELVGEHRLLTNAPYGHLYVGAAPPHNYVGSVDEIAIFERALHTDEVRALAAAEGPLQPLPAAQPPEGFRVKPVPGMHYLVIQHSALPRTAWMLRIPEYTGTGGDGDPRYVAHDVVWERDPDTGQWRWHWGADRATKEEARLDFHGVITVEENVIRYSLTARNVGDEPWQQRPMGLFCFKAPDSPDFVDYEAERTYVRRGGEWVTMGEVVEHEFADHRMCGIAVGDGPDQASPLTAKVSVDGSYVMGIATDIAGSLSFNFQTRTNCMHSNPAWDLLKPGQDQTATGCIYFLEGTLDDLWQRYLQDFEQ